MDTGARRREERREEPSWAVFQRGARWAVLQRGARRAVLLSGLLVLVLSSRLRCASDCAVPHQDGAAHGRGGGLRSAVSGALIRCEWGPFDLLIVPMSVAQEGYRGPVSCSLQEECSPPPALPVERQPANGALPAWGPRAGPGGARWPGRAGSGWVGPGGAGRRSTGRDTSSELHSLPGPMSREGQNT